MGSDQPPPPAVTNIYPSSCGWDKPFYPDQKPVDFAKRWTRNEMLWLVNHNDTVKKNCPAP